MSELSIYMCAAALVAAACHIMIVMNRKPEEKKNYEEDWEMKKNNECFSKTFDRALVQNPSCCC